MQPVDQIYLIASFRDAATLQRAAKALGVPQNHLVALGSEGSGATGAAQALGIATKLDSDFPLDPEQAGHLEWHLANRDTPLLAVLTMAAQGRDLRLRLVEELGGEMLAKPALDVQVNDLDVDPVMMTEDVTRAFPSERLSDAQSGSGDPDAQSYHSRQ